MGKRLTTAVLQALLGVGDLGHVRRSNQDAGSVSLKLRPGGGLEVRLAGGELRTLECGKVRASCRCAHCVDEFTHEVKIDQDSIRADATLRALEVRPVGNYAMNVQFSDGHNTVVALRALEQLVGGGAAAWKPPATTKDGGW